MDRYQTASSKFIYQKRSDGIIRPCLTSAAGDLSRRHMFTKINDAKWMLAVFILNCDHSSELVRINEDH